MNTHLAALTSVPVRDQLELTLLMLWAMALGAFVGVERERASKATGIRTHMLVAGAAALVAAVSSTLTADGIGDQSRGIHGVITGIGFLGAGAIIQSKKDGMVTGMTTAASIFYTAAIGCAVAVGYGVAATLGTLLGIAVLYGIGYISYRHPVPGSMRDKLLHPEGEESTGERRD
jgi:putative Mg2+ transporter-C (MgtC) family protein